MTPEKQYATGEAVAAYRKATANESEHRRLARIESQRRAEAVAELHALGWSYRDIAADLGLSHSRVAQMVARHKEQQS